MIFLDTHIVVWLFEADFSKISKSAIQAIEENELIICPMVFLELEYLFEIKRIRLGAQDIYHDLNDKISLKILDRSWEKVTSLALEERWTRDPFDRLIVAQAKLEKKQLVTLDKKIKKNYEHCIS